MFIQFFLNRISIYELNGIQDYYKNKYFFLLLSKEIY